MLKRKFILSTLLLSVISLVVFCGIPESYAVPSIYVSPPVTTAEIGESFIASIKIRNAENVFAWEFKLGWNVTLLDFVRVAEGDFLKGIEQAPTFFVNVTHEGYITLACTRKGALPGVAGSGELVSVTFKATAKGETTLDLYDTKLRDSIPNPIDHTSTDGLFSNIAALPRPIFSWIPLIPDINEEITFDASESYDPDDLPLAQYYWDFGDESTANETDPIAYHSYSEGGSYVVTLTVTDQAGWNNSLAKDLKVRFEHDIVIYSVTQSQETVTAGDTLTVTVKVANEGSNDETGISVAAYYDTTAIGSAQTIDSLASGQNKTLTFNWNTGGIAENTYRIKAVATPVAGETSTSDNTKLGGTVTVNALPGLPWMYIGAGIVVVVVVVVVVFFLMRRRK